MKKKLFKYFILVLIIIVGSVFFYFTRPAPDSGQKNLLNKEPHAYKDPAKSIANIEIKAFYVLPKDGGSSADSRWHEILEDTLKNAARFHDFQFQNLSHLDYEIYPEPVTLSNPNSFYNCGCDPNRDRIGSRDSTDNKKGKNRTDQSPTAQEKKIRKEEKLDYPVDLETIKINVYLYLHALFLL